MDVVKDVGVDVARETLTGDVRDMLLAEARDVKQSLPWNLRSEADQREIVDRVTAFAEELVEKVGRIIAADGRKIITGTVKRVVRGSEKIEAVVTVPSTDELRHELFDAAGSTVLLVVADMSAYVGERHIVPITPDQADMLGDDKPVFDNTNAGRDDKKKRRKDGAGDAEAA